MSEWAASDSSPSEPLRTPTTALAAVRPADAMIEDSATLCLTSCMATGLSVRTTRYCRRGLFEAARLLLQLPCEHGGDLRQWSRLHHVHVFAVDFVYRDLTADVRDPPVCRRSDLAARGGDNQHVAGE